MGDSPLLLLGFVLIVSANGKVLLLPRILFLKIVKIKYTYHLPSCVFHQSPVAAPEYR